VQPGDNQLTTAHRAFCQQWIHPFSSNRMSSACCLSPIKINALMVA